MASADKTKTTAELAADETPAILDAVEAPEASAVDAAIAKAQDAELARQAGVEAAVAKANATELPKLGGPLMEPGLGR
jgi:hypothetical protein